jgi:hypothetical protein
VLKTRSHSFRERVCPSMVMKREGRLSAADSACSGVSPFSRRRRTAVGCRSRSAAKSRSALVSPKAVMVVALRPISLAAL